MSITENQIRLHHVPASRSFRVLWLLAEMGEDCAIETYDIAGGSLRSPEYLAINPTGRVPALEVDGRVLMESGAIVEYLCETRPGHGLGRMPGEAERADYLQWMHFAETQANLVQELNLQWIFMPAELRSKAVLQIQARRLAATAKVLEAALSGRDWLLPSGFSAVDVMMGFNVFALPRYIRMDKFPAITAYAARISERPAYKAARARDGVSKFYSQDYYDPETL